MRTLRRALDGHDGAFFSSWQEAARTGKRLDAAMPQGGTGARSRAYRKKTKRLPSPPPPGPSFPFTAGAGASFFLARPCRVFILESAVGMETSCWYLDVPELRRWNRYQQKYQQKTASPANLCRRRRFMTDKLESKGKAPQTSTDCGAFVHFVMGESLRNYGIN